MSDDLPGWQTHDSEGGHIEGWPAWALHVQAFIREAATSPAPVLLVDRDFHRWPLGERATVDAFHDWALAQRQARCWLLAEDWVRVHAVHPRWLQWRQTWTHKVLCRAPADEDRDGSAWSALRPMLVQQGRLGLQMLDGDRGIAVWTRRPAVLADWWHQGDAILQRSCEATPGATLGL